MQRLNQLNIANSITALVYGKSGAGKTWFAGSAGSRALFIDTGNGIATLTSRAFKTAYPNANPIVISVKENLDARGVVVTPKAFDQVCDIIDDAIHNYRSDFDCIIIDDLTSLTQFALNKALDLNKMSGKSSTLATAQSKRTLPLVAVQDYGTLIDALKFFLGTYTTLAKEHGFHLICTAHERTVYKPGKVGEDAKLSRVFPQFPGKDYFAPSVVPALFDEVYHLELRGNKRVIRTRPNEIYLAKTRYSMELEEFENDLDFPKLLKKIQPTEVNPTKE